MKKIILAICFMSSTTLMFAQSRYNNRNRPPLEVQQSFEREYPNMNSNTRWSRDNNGWHATYRDGNNRDVNAYYDGRGNRQHTRIAWNRRDIPRDIDNNIYRTYRTRNYKAVRIERPNNDPLFQISLNFGGRNRVVYMDEQGRSRRYQ
jgi:hypothetical protein